MIFLDGDEIYFAGNAALKICSYLSFPWNVLSPFRFLPEWFLDFFYGLIAKHRYQVFGKTTCLVPKKEDRSRFLS